MSVDGAEKPGTPSSRETDSNDTQSKHLSTVTALELDGAKSWDWTSDLEIRNRAGESSMPGSSSANATNTLLPKFLRTTQMLLGSRSFFFSYELDITRRLGKIENKGSEIPLHRSVDPLVSF